METILKILHLEDLPSDAELVTRTLQTAGIKFNKLNVDTEEAFVKALQEFYPDIILSDHSLPSFNSIEALKIIQEMGITVPFILITSTVSEEFAVSILKQGADDYILKDNMSRLPSAIQHVMEIVEHRREKLRAEKALKSAHARLMFHLENSPLAYIEWDNDLKLKIWSKRAEKIFGWTMKELNDSMTGYEIVFRYNDQLQVKDVIEQLISGKVTRNTSESRNYTKDGRVIWCEWFNSVLKDDEGKVMTVMSMVQDITDRKNAEQKLEKSESRFREFFETAPEAVLVLDPATRAFIDHNENALKLLGYQKEEVIGKSPLDFCPAFQADGQSSLDKILEMDIAVLQGKLPIFDFILRTKMGVEIFCEIRLTKLTETDRPLIRASILDITERVNLERQLIDEEIKKQVEITDAVIIAQEQERAFLGEEMHDNINQLLATSKLYLDFSISSEDVRKDMITKGRNYILDAMEGIRKLSKSLIAPSLGEITLEEAIADMLTDIELVDKIHFTKEWQIQDEEKMNAKFKLTIFRIIQEQLNNIIKHARASNVLIRLIQRNNFLQLIIRDDGVGFDVATRKRGVGLKNIVSRSKLFSGDVNIISTPGKGCEIIVLFDMNFMDQAE